jgi:hypothetical protein
VGEVCLADRLRIVQPEPMADADRVEAFLSIDPTRVAVILVD